VKRGIVVCLVVAAALAVVAAAAAVARDPRLERLRLAPADTRLARGAVVVRSDLGTGWARAPIPKTTEQAPNCPGYRPNFSKFTVTGQASSQFVNRSTGRSVLARVEVYRTKAQARADFALSTRPPVARCLGILLQRESAKAGAASGVTATIASSRRVTAPRLGERSAAYRVVSVLASSGASIRVHVDARVVQRGRSIGTIYFTGAVKPVPGQQGIAARMARRLR
jgi:hypothetical protein